MDKSIKNKVVIVTGGATGLGLNMVDKFLEHGAEIAIIVDINEDLGVEAAKQMTEKHGTDKAAYLKCDVTTDMNETFEIIITKYKRVDVLVNNAGVNNEKSIRNTIDINLTALMEWTVEFYDYMRTDTGGYGGTIINIASIYGFKIIQFAPNYNASKFGVVGFSKSIGHEYNYKRTNVRVIAVCPGYTYTELTAKPCLREDDLLEDCVKLAESFPWQEAEVVGKEVVEIFKKADSGTVWVVEGSQPAVMV